MPERTCFISFLSFADKRFYEEFQKKYEGDRLLLEGIDNFLEKNTDDRKLILPKSEGRTGSMLATIEEIKKDQVENIKIIVVHDFGQEDFSAEMERFFAHFIRKIFNDDSSMDFIRIKKEANENIKELYKTIYNLTSRYENVIINLSGGNSVMQGANYIYAAHHKDKVSSYIVTKDTTPKKIEIPKFHRAKMPEDSPGGKEKVESLEELANESACENYKKICKDLIKYARKGDINVFIGGESGTGKEVIARAFAREIYENRNITQQDFPTLNCAAITDTLSDYELFGIGSKKIADVNPRDGLLLHASKNGGVIFLDEVCDLSLEIQAKLLRVIQEKKVRRVGEDNEMELKDNFIIISASHKNIWHEVAKGKFREDLAYRLTYGEVELPNLKSRGIEDIKLAALNIYHSSSGNTTKQFDEVFQSGCADILAAFDWRGNFRTLQKIIIRAYIDSDEDHSNANQSFDYYISNVQLQKQIDFVSSKINEMEDIKRRLSNTPPNFHSENKNMDNSSSHSGFLKFIISQNDLNSKSIPFNNNCNIQLIFDTEHPEICIDTLNKFVEAEILNYKDKQGKKGVQIGAETNIKESTLSTHFRRLRESGYIK